MGYQMKLDDMQEALSRASHPQANAFEQALCAIGDAMAEALSEQFDVDIGGTEQHGQGFAGICCAFNPRYRKQPLPEAFECFDDDEAWFSDDASLPPMPRGKRTSRDATLGKAVAARLRELRADRDGYVLGAPNGSETPDPEGWARDNPDDANELNVLTTLEI